MDVINIVNIYYSQEPNKPEPNFGPICSRTNSFLAISYLNARSTMNKLSILENYIANMCAKTDIFSSQKHGLAAHYLILYFAL